MERNSAGTGVVVCFGSRCQCPMIKPRKDWPGCYFKLDCYPQTPIEKEYESKLGLFQVNPVCSFSRRTLSILHCNNLRQVCGLRAYVKNLFLARRHRGGMFRAHRSGKLLGNSAWQVFQ